LGFDQYSIAHFAIEHIESDEDEQQSPMLFHKHYPNKLILSSAHAPPG
jgi:hypothetical protein